MPLRVCLVSFKSPTGITHGVEVEAETLYEAAGLGLARLKKDGWIEGLGPGSRLDIQVREPSTVHSLTVVQLHRWIDGGAKGPADVLRRARVKQHLGISCPDREESERVARPRRRTRQQGGEHATGTPRRLR
jgi:hypothetical protein